MKGRAVALAAALLAAARGGAAQRVEFLTPDGAGGGGLARADRDRIAGWVRDTSGRLHRLTGLSPRRARIVIFPDVSRFLFRTGLPPWIGAVTVRRGILLQPPAILERSGALERVVRHEAVHHFFFGRDWPEALHEALAHRYSGGGAAPSPRAGPLCAGRRTAIEEVEWHGHLAWELDCVVAPLGDREFFHRLLAGRLDLSVFRSASP